MYYISFSNRLYSKETPYDEADLNKSQKSRPNTPKASKVIA